MNRRVYRSEINTLSITLFCFLATASVLHAEDRARAIIEESGFAGGVVVHVHGADTSLLQSIQSQRPNLLGRLLVSQDSDAQRARETLVAAGLHGSA